VDGRDVSVDGAKLDGIEAGADVTDTANVTAAGALMDSELTNIAAVKALDQGVATTDSPSFAGLTATTADINGGTIDGTVIGGSSAAAGTFTTVSFTGADLTASNAAGPALLNEAASSSNPTLVPNKATPATGMGASGSNTGYLISNGTEHLRWGFGATVITGVLLSSSTHTVGTNSSGNSATLQKTNGFEFKLNGDTSSQYGIVSWVNNSGATTANLWATGDSSSSGIIRLKGIGNIDLVAGSVGIDGTAAQLRVNTSRVDLSVPMQLPSYTVAGLPTGAAGDMAYCTNETGGAIPVFSDGTNWRRVTDRAVAA